ncbi:MAG: ComEC/Rec2 family competence protein, partial [bacterium]
LPLNLHSSGTFDVNNVLANFVVIPFFCFIYYPINIVLMLLFFSGVHSVIYLMNISTDVLLYLLRFFSWISRFTKIKTFNANTTEVIILYTVLLLFFFGIKYSKHFNVRKIIYFYIAVTAISITTVLYFSFFEYKQKNELIIFDLQKPKRIAGSGDILFISNGSKNIIVDTGFGKFSSQKVISKIKRRKVDIIDYLIITHSDFDHIGGMKDFLSEFYVRNIIISRAEYYYFLQNGLMNKTNVVLACDGINLELDRASSIRFFHPNCKQEHKNTYKYKKENNETVLSFFVSLADYKFMINSDLPKKHLEEILRNNKREAPNLVCQMPHHCNKKDNPSELLNSSKPILGFCTRDRTLLEKSKLFSNDFTFPIFMTGVCGDIDIRVENSGLAVFSEKCSKLSLQLKGS